MNPTPNPYPVDGEGLSCAGSMAQLAGRRDFCANCDLTPKPLSNPQVRSSHCYGEGSSITVGSRANWMWQTAICGDFRWQLCQLDMAKRGSVADGWQMMGNGKVRRPLPKPLPRRRGGALMAGLCLG